MFGLMYTSMYGVAIISGLVAQSVADAIPFRPISENSIFHVGGYCGPFELAIICLLVGMVLIAVLWTENFGADERGESTTVLEKFTTASRLLRTDRNTLLLCVVVSCFEGSMFAFVFNWTPALESKTTPPPYGLIFALFMMSCMIGSSVATIVGNEINTIARLAVTFLLGVVAFSVISRVAGSEHFLMTSFVAFLIFEFCCGLYFPTVGVLKSEVVPEHIRGTMYNIYRVPLNCLVVGLLLSDISMVRCFVLCASLLTIALISVMGISVNKRDSECSPLSRAR
jgi:MFS family permease